MEPIKLPVAVVEAINFYLKAQIDRDISLEDAKLSLVSKHNTGDDWNDLFGKKAIPLNDLDAYVLMRAMVLGYEIEETPEQKIKQLEIDCTRLKAFNQSKDKEIEKYRSVLTSVSSDLENLSNWNNVDTKPMRDRIKTILS